MKIPLRANRVGHDILSTVDFRRDPSRSLPCPEASASFFHIVQRAADLSDGGLHLPYTQDGPYHFEPPLTFAARKAATLGGAENCRLPNPKKLAMKLHVSWGHASAQQLMRALVDSGGDHAHLITCVDEELAQCEGCQAFDREPHDPVAGTSTVAMCNEKLQADLLL